MSDDEKHHDARNTDASGGGSATKRTLVEWRLIRRMTQLELASASGVSVSTISGIEYRGQSPMAETRDDIAHALGITAAQIEWPTGGGRRRKRGPRRGTSIGGSGNSDEESEGVGTTGTTTGDRPKFTARAAA